jgi:signal transduction histidine kinase/CheY-like chemotaxis protein
MKRMDGAAVATQLKSLDAGGGTVLDAQDDIRRLFTDAAFSAVFDSSAEALIVVDQRGAFQKANSRARRLLSLPEGTAASSDWKDFPVSPALSLDFAQIRARGITSQVLAARGATLARGCAIRITLRAILPGSQDLLLLLEEEPGSQGADKKLQVVEAELSSVIDSVQVGIILFNPEGRLRFSNARFGQYFSLGSQDLEHVERFEELERLVAQRFRDPARFSIPWKSFLAGEAQARHDELEITRPANRVLERFSRPVFDGEGHSIGWLELYSDVTGERQIQSKLLQTEKMAALGQLVSGIAHELNNPLTTIMGYGQLLLGHGLTAAQLSEARKVFHEAERARRIVKNLLYFARENKPERTRVDLNEIVERTLALRSYELRVEDIAVECDLDADLPETMADPYQLQQVVLNLLVNAEQALLEDRGKGHVWIRTRRIGSSRISLEVSDDGPGIQPEVASRIFDPFFTTKPSGVGTGLGLSIIYGIVQQHDGEVSFENVPGTGAKFIVELPLIEIPISGREPVLPHAAKRSPDTTRGRILVVEDEPTVAQLIADVLREEGHEVETVLDSQEGLTRLSRNWYDLVICDLRMPRLDGPAFYDALVRAGRSEKHRIIFVTGDILVPRTLEFLETNGLPYLAKPFLVEELKLAVNRRLERNWKSAKTAHSSRASKIRNAARRTRKV